MSKGTNTVILFKGEKHVGTQSVSIDEENWVSLSHNGSEITLSKENADKLFKLYTRVVQDKENQITLFEKGTCVCTGPISWAVGGFCVSCNLKKNTTNE
jgi:hypothetical protein